MPLQFLDDFSQTSVIRWVAESDWGYPIVLTGHAIGMSLVVGIMMIYELRVLGLGQRIPLPTFRPLFRVAWLGFAINLTSGTLLFCANYVAFIRNAAFISKISLLCLAALVSWWLVRHVGPAETTAARRARLIASLGLLLWLGAIAAGRIVAYTNVPD